MNPENSVQDNFIQDSSVQENNVSKYFYEKYVFYLDESVFVRMVILSKIEYEHENNELYQKYKTVSSFSEELPIKEMPNDIKKTLDAEGSIEKRIEITKELFDNYSQLDGRELLSILPLK